MKGRNLTLESLEYLFSNFDLSYKSCIDLFAKDGSRQSHFFYDKVRSMEMWEIDPAVASKAKLKFPNANVVCCDSIDKIKNDSWRDSFDIILVDNPLSTYCNNVYCENFDVIDHIHKAINDEALCLINIVVQPFDIENEKNKIWKNRRLDFFGEVNIEIDQAVDVYVSKFKKSGLNVTNVKFFDREEYNNNVYLYHALFSLKK